MSRENGLAVFGRFFALPRDTKQQLAFTYKTPPVVDKQGGVWTYTLDLQRQPGWELPLNLHVSPPAGMHAEQALVDGEAVARTAGGGMKIDLSRDRLITVRFKSDS